MSALLAIADSRRLFDDPLPIILSGGAILVAICALALAPVWIAARRSLRRRQALFTLVMFWSMLALGVAAFVANANFSWSREYAVRLASGDMDPQDLRDAPTQPWPVWIGLAGAYAGLLTFSALGRSKNSMVAK